MKPNNSPDDSPSNVGIGTLIGYKFRLEEKLGQGSFGMIFKCLNLESQETYAMKMEKRNARHQSMLVREIKVMIELKNEFGYARMVSYGKDDDYNYVVMTSLGKNLDNILKKCGQRFSLSTCMNIAEQMITRLEVLHNHNLIHRDIKPENFVIGPDRYFHMVYLIDFGLAKYYKDSEGNHIPEVEKKGMIGTARYASVNAHKGFEQSRRDDLEALGYVLMYFIRGKLPWQQIYADTKEEKYEKIKNMKMNSPLEQMCEGCPPELVQYLRMVKKLEFKEQPNYAALKQLFKKVIIDRRLEGLAQQVDWETLPDYRYRKKFISTPAVDLSPIPSQKDIALKQQQMILEKQQRSSQLQAPLPQNNGDNSRLTTNKTDSAKRISIINNTQQLLEAPNQLSTTPPGNSENIPTTPIPGKGNKNENNIVSGNKIPSGQLIQDKKKLTLDQTTQPVKVNSKPRIDNEVQQKALQQLQLPPDQYLKQVPQEKQQQQQQFQQTQEIIPVGRKPFEGSPLKIPTNSPKNSPNRNAINSQKFSTGLSPKKVTSPDKASMESKTFQEYGKQLNSSKASMSVSNQNNNMAISTSNNPYNIGGSNVPISLLHLGFQHGQQSGQMHNLLNIPNQNSISQASLNTTSKVNHFSASDSDTILDEGGIQLQNGTMIIDKNACPLTTSEIRNDIRTKSLVFRQSHLELIDMHDHQKYAFSLNNLHGASILKMESKHAVEEYHPNQEIQIDSQNEPRGLSPIPQSLSTQTSTSKMPPKVPTTPSKKVNTANYVRPRSSTSSPAYEEIKEHQDEESYKKSNKQQYKSQITPITEVKESTNRSLKTRPSLPSFVGENITESIYDRPIFINTMSIKQAFKKS